MVTPPPLAFNSSFEGVPVIWVKQHIASAPQWCLETFSRATNALHWKFGIQKTLFRASTFSTPALRGLPHSSQNLRRAACLVFRRGHIQNCWSWLHELCIYGNLCTIALWRKGEQYSTEGGLQERWKTWLRMGIQKYAFKVWKIQMFVIFYPIFTGEI